MSLLPSSATKPGRVSFSSEQISQIQKKVNSKIDDWLAFDCSIQKKKPKEVTFDNFEAFRERQENAVEE